ncbi:hypothetical protein GH733_011829 [Mirounga leonina]|nr:hypothetical protein GH733_011829 [Mirounga leonina]
MSTQIHQNYSTEVETAISCLVNMHLQASYTFLSLGFYFDHEDLALEGMDHFFRELAEEKNEDRQHPLKMQNQPRAAPISRTCRSCSKMSGIKPWIPWNLRGPGEKPEAGPLGSVSAHADPHLCSFLENGFLGEQVKLIEKMVTTWLTSQAWPPGWAG